MAIQTMGKPGPDPKVTDKDILRAICLNYAPVMTPKQLAERFDVSNTAISNKLDRIEESGRVESERVGRARVYWLTDEGRAQVDPSRSESDNQ